MKRYLKTAGVPEALHAETLINLADAHKRSKGLTAHKLKVRLLRAGKIAKALPWKAERLLDVKQEWARYDIAPVRNITAQGDNIPWDDNGPIVGAWLDDTPEARKANYWCKGEHPRSQKSRKAWYRRNGGEYEAWVRGVAIDRTKPVESWSGQKGRVSVEVFRWGSAWIVNTVKSYGFFRITGRFGFECDNARHWVTLPGYDFRAPVTWGWRIRLGTS